MIKAVIFDWGGVIAPNAHGGWFNLLADMLHFSVEELLPHWHAAGYRELAIGAIDESIFWKQLEESLGIPLPADVHRIWIDGGAIHPSPEMISFIDELRSEGVSTAVLSNTVKPLSAVLRESGLYDHFEVVILSDEERIAKPDPAIYQLALSKLELTAEECIYIDDLQRNLPPASKLGMSTVLASDVPNKTIAQVRQIIDEAKTSS